jgi:putative salt-induced outer membrane protein YdiY
VTRWSARPGIVALLIAMAAPLARAADKTDIVMLNTGDRITCEIKRLERGRLTVKTDPMDTVTIHWGDVVSVTSTRHFEIEVASGIRYYGSLKADAPGIIVVVGALAGTTSLNLLDVVRVTPLGESFWNRMDGAIDLGYSYTRASEQTQWTLNANASYRARRYLTQGSVSSQLTAIQGADSTSRNTLTLSSRRFLGRRWFTAGLGQLQQDQALGLDYRSVLGGAAGRYLIQRQATTFSVFAGVAYTRERFQGDSTENSAEGLVGADWEWFTPGDNDTDLSSTVLTYYSLSGDARARIEFNTSYSQKLVKDLHWSLNLFDSYNGDPPEGQKANDFGVSITLGWSF